MTRRYFVDINALRADVKLVNGRKGSRNEPGPSWTGLGPGYFKQKPSRVYIYVCNPLANGVFNIIKSGDRRGGSLAARP